MFQDGAPAHTGTRTQEFLMDNVQEFLPNDGWPPTSPGKFKLVLY